MLPETPPETVEGTAHIRGDGQHGVPYALPSSHARWLCSVAPGGGALRATKWDPFRFSRYELIIDHYVF
jgi:hypothetical protein